MPAVFRILFRVACWLVGVQVNQRPQQPERQHTTVTWSVEFLGGPLDGQVEAVQYPPPWHVSRCQSINSRPHHYYWTEDGYRYAGAESMSGQRAN